MRFQRAYRQKPQHRRLLVLIVILCHSLLYDQTAFAFISVTRPISCTVRSTCSARLYAVPHPASAATASASVRAAPVVVKLQTSLMGKIWPILVKLHVNSEKLGKIGHALKSHVEPQDVIFVGIMALIAFCHVEQKHLKNKKSSLDRSVSSFLQKLWLVKSVQSLAQVALSAYAVDVVCLILRVQGFHFPHLWDVPRVYAKISLGSWCLLRFLEWKKQALRRVFGKSGRTDLMNKAINGISVILMGLLVLDWLSVEMGLALKGVVTFGSLWTLALTLASKDLVAQLVSGLFLQASNKMTKGEKVKFGEGSSGKVVNIGWIETSLRGSDNTITSIPNAKLANEKVVNFSRVQISQVQQQLWFHYEDIDEIPALLESIRAEIKASCPKLILDGSRPFRVYFTDYAENCLQVMVDTHFYISPTSEEYWVNRQEVLLAINRAVKNHHLQYAYDVLLDPTSQQELHSHSVSTTIGIPKSEAWLQQPAISAATKNALPTAPDNAVTGAQ